MREMTRSHLVSSIKILNLSAIENDFEYHFIPSFHILNNNFLHFSLIPPNFYQLSMSWCDKIQRNGITFNFIFFALSFTLQIQPAIGMKACSSSSLCFISNVIYLTLTHTKNSKKLYVMKKSKL